MDEAALRDWLRKRLSTPAIPEEVWQDLGTKGFINDALDTDYPNGKAVLQEEAERLLKFMRLGAARPSPRGRSRQQEYRPFLNLTREERMRAEVLSIYIAKHAATTELVQSFRRAVMQGGVMSQEQAVAFLTSPATCIFEQKRFTAYDIPLFDHHAEVIDETELAPVPTIVAGTHCNIYRKHATLRIEWPGGSREETRTYESPPHLPWHNLEPPPMLSFFGCDDETQYVGPWPGSILNFVGEASRALVKRYSGLWTEAQAIRFLLTDAAPYIAPLHVRMTQPWYGVNDAAPTDDLATRPIAPWPLSLTRPQITLTVDTWVSDKTVLRTYRRAQRQMLNRDNRPPKEHSLALLRFITNLDRLFEMTWDERMTVWNKAQTNPDWKYADVGNFCDAFRRAEHLLCHPEISVQNGTRRKRQQQDKTGKH